MQKLEIDFHQNSSYPFEDTAKDYGGIYVGDIEVPKKNIAHSHNDSVTKISYITLPNQILTHTTDHEYKSSVAPFETITEQQHEVNCEFVAQSTSSKRKNA